MRKHYPAVLRHDAHQVTFDLPRVRFFGEIEALGDPLYVCIDHHPAGDPVGRSEDDIGGFAGRPWYGKQFFDGAGDRAAELIHYFPGRSYDRLGLVVEEPS